jgi:alkylation response protein AidB-like acyl-CoA dehydrogenase
MRATSSDTIRYEDCFVRREDCLGGIAALAGIDLTGFGLGYAAIYLGIGEAAFDYIVEYVKTHRFGLPDALAQHPTTQRSLGEMATAIRAARALLADAAHVKMQGDRREIALAINESKSFSADVGAMVTERAIRLAGGRGILRRYPLERWHRDALCGPVMAPANDRCMETVGKILCGLEGKTLEFV